MDNFTVSTQWDDPQTGISRKVFTCGELLDDLVVDGKATVLLHVVVAGKVLGQPANVGEKIPDNWETIATLEAWTIKQGRTIDALKRSRQLIEKLNSDALVIS